jgi:arylsulfatase A-like enzyme
MVPAGVETDALTDFSDILPTFLELGGGKIPENFVLDGVSIAPLILGKDKGSERQWIMSLGGGAGRLTKGGVRGKKNIWRASNSGQEAQGLGVHREEDRSPARPAKRSVGEKKPT